MGRMGLEGERGAIQLEIAHNDEDTKTPPSWKNRRRMPIGIRRQISYLQH